MAYEDYEAVIGLEIHAQLKTKSKMFCSCSVKFGEGDNKNSCPVCTGMPGALPVLNRKAIEFAAKTGFALQAKVREESVFARKNYFYPDMPRGYQISQFDRPVVEDGVVTIDVDGQKKEIRVQRAHLEEDAGKSIHQGDHTLINFNRASVPLLEIVSHPDMSSPAEAAEYARVIRRTLRYLEVCDGNLEEGSLRCDCNVSVRKKGETELGTKVEIKNINSFRFVEKALQHEIERQIDAVESGETIVQETRLYDSDKNRTTSMRKKEDAQDYRYFPEPDLLPLTMSEGDLQRWRSELPELAPQRAERYIREFQLGPQEVALLVDEREMSDFFEEVIGHQAPAGLAAKWLVGEFTYHLKENRVALQEAPVNAKALAELLVLIDQDKISQSVAKTVLLEMWQSQKSAAEIVSEKGLEQVSDQGAIAAMIGEVIDQHPQQVEQYRAGKEKIIGFLVGQVMKRSQGKVNPEMAKKALQDQLKGDG